MKSITIKEIYVTNNKLYHKLQIDDCEYLVETELSENVLKYAVTDRIDSIVMGLLMFAIRNGYDFFSELPITDELLYNIQNHFLNAIVGDTKLHKVNIDCPTCPRLKQIGHIVSTGVSCGVDSLYTILHHNNYNVSDEYRLTHMTFMNLGSHHKENGMSTAIYNERRNHILKYCNEINLPLIEIKSNLPDIINVIDPNKYSHINYHSFMAVFAVLNISYGLSRYYYSSGYSYRDFTCRYPINGELDSALFDLLTLNVASYSTKFSSFGGGVNRIEKLGYISKFPKDASFLNVCVNGATNCGECFKCKRTLLEIDALGKKDIFAAAFDMNQYTIDKKDFLRWLYMQHLKKDPYAEELMPYFKLSFLFKTNAIIKKIGSVIHNKILR